MKIEPTSSLKNATTNDEIRLMEYVLWGWRHDVFEPTNVVNDADSGGQRPFLPTRDGLLFPYTEAQ